MSDDEASVESPNIPTVRMIAWVKNSTAYRLSRKLMTERELSTAIARKARQKFETISDDQVEALVGVALDFGRTLGALDDQTYAQVKLRSSVAGGRSRRVIARKLAEKGVDHDIIAETVAETDDLDAAVIFARKRAFGPFRRGEGDAQRLTKELSAFARGGFSLSLGRRVLAMERDEADEILAARGGW